MSSRKKLELGPLPEQREDYSSYEESVIRWDRIIGVGLVLLFLLFLLIKLFVGSSSEESAEASQPFSKLNSAQNKVVSKSTAVSEPSGTTDIEATKMTLPPKAEVVAKQPTTQHASLPEEAEPSITKVSVPNASPTAIEKPSTAKTVNESTKNTRPASVLITNSGIKEAALYLSTEQGLPGEAVKQSIVMPEKGLIKVMLSTRMEGLKGRKLYHDWYRNGKRQARVKIPVNVAQQKSYSSKFIDKYMLGTWQVKVVDSAGEPYILADFEVVDEG